MPLCTMIFNQLHNNLLGIPRAITGWATKGSARWLGLFLQSGRDNFGRKVKVSSEKLDAIVGEEPVIVHPSKGLPYVLAGLEALHQLNHLQIRHINLRVLRQIEVLLRIANSLCKKSQIIGPVETLTNQYCTY